MSPLRDQRTPEEIAAAQTMRLRGRWPWPALRSNVEQLASEGFSAAQIAQLMDVPWSFVSQEYREHGRRPPLGLKSAA